MKWKNSFPAVIINVSWQVIPNSREEEEACYNLLAPRRTWSPGRCTRPTLGCQVSPHTHPLGRGLSPFVMVNERSAWLHFLIPFPPRLRWGPATHCTAVISLTPPNPPPLFFFHSREVWPIMLSHIPLFNSLHATLPHLWHPTPPLHTTPHHTHKHTHAYLPFPLMELNFLCDWHVRCVWQAAVPSRNSDFIISCAGSQTRFTEWDKISFFICCIILTSLYQDPARLWQMFTRLIINLGEIQRALCCSVLSQIKMSVLLLPPAAVLPALCAHWDIWPGHPARHVPRQ